MIRLISVSLVLCAPWTLILWDEPDEARADDTAAVDFNRDVRPLLADRCFKCHGPNESDRKAGLRLDVREGAIADHDGLRAIVPGAPEASELVRRITAGDEDRMPPHKEGKRLAAADVELLQRWIEEGAEWKEHWSFVPPEKPALPALRDEEWPLTPIDFFIAAKLDEEGLAPAPEADRETLIRRLTQDLTGLPPTLEEIDAFLEDEGADAYDKVVDRLLASPSFGEHMALTWLDCSRYADTNGYHRDGNRSMWLWRDWLIDAFNRNLPYDRFVVEQLAGDLLPDATVDQKVATGFNRNHMVNDEGGAIAEEYQVEYVVDRVRTTSTVFMGLTMQCAQCHDHKYDPITQEDYYRFYAFLNKVPEKGLDGADANPVPSMSVPRPEDQVKIDAVQERLDAIETRMAAPQPELDAGELVWAEARAREIGERWSTLALEDLEATYGIELEALDDGSVLADGENPDRSDYSFRARTQEQHITALRLEVLTHESFPNQAATRTSHGNWVLSELELEAVSLADPNLRETVRFESAVADYSQQDYEVSKAVDGEKSTGWAVDGHERRECRTAIFVPAEPFGFEGGTELLFKMRHEYGSQHTLGRFRYSIATAANLARDHKASKLGVWHFAGPFPGEPENLFKTDSGPEAEGPDRDLAATYLDGQIAWEPREDLTDGETHTFEGERSAFYLYRTLEAETARSISLSLGSDDSMVMWLNGVRVHDHPDPRSVAADQDRLDLQLVEGANELLIKIVNYGGPAGVYFRVVSEGPPVPAGDLTAALAVPATERTEAHAFAIRDVYRRDHWEEWPSMSAEAEEARAEDRGHPCIDAAALGHGRRTRCAHDLHARARPIRQARQRGPRRGPGQPACDSRARGRPRTRSPRPGALAGLGRASAHRARRRQPPVADSVRDRPGRQRRGLRRPGRVALPRATPGLARSRARRKRVGHQSHAARDGALEDLQAGVAGRRPGPGTRSAQSSVGARVAQSPTGRIGARPCAHGQRPPDAHDRRSERQALPTRGAVGGDDLPQREPRRARLLQAGHGRRSLSPRHVHVLEAFRAAAQHARAGRAHTRDLHGPAFHDQHAPASAGAAQRPRPSSKRPAPWPSAR